MHATDIQKTFDPLADLVRSAGINAYACEPLLVGDRLLGTLSFASRARRSFDPDDLSFFRTIANMSRTPGTAPGGRDWLRWSPLRGTHRPRIGPET